MKENLRECLFEGKIIPFKNITIDDLWRGFLYGDGIFDTLRVRNYVIFRWEHHWERLVKNACFCNLSINKEKEEVEEDIIRLLKKAKIEDAYVRINVWRKAPLFFDPQDERESFILIIARPYHPYPDEFYQKGIRCMVSKNFYVNEKSILSRVKSLSFAGNVLARIEAKMKGYDDAILLNSKGEISEATVANLFFIIKGKLFTPSLECGILEGITRNLVLEICERLDIEFEEGKYTISSLKDADEVFITNTLCGILPVREIEGIFKSDNFPITQYLVREYEKLFISETKGRRKNGY